MIEPYYQEPNIKIYCGDCLEIMKEIPDNSIDLVLTDPPYGVGLKYDIYEDTENNWYKLFNNMMPSILRISTMTILPCCQIKRLVYIYHTFPPDWIICWYKGSTGARAAIGFNDWEPLLVYGKNKGIYMHDYFHMPNNEKMGNYGHPCPKPLGWARWLINRAAKQGHVVLDPFLGSGTTLVVCKELGRQGVGIEISKGYCDIAIQRLKNTTPSLL